ncbi:MULTISPECIES: DUF4342 domain-containing protein [unclassified Mucilaginibacter]|uniref:DUF4342 domain-containing protein n=1 Tax=unclassified Mucilaginibacter TaxID=2617802 RepID=UPI002AC93901|nr:MULTISPECIES: DUF4342 domain-containing protein [unclassified Mucilaginibacter]MEB0262691.1 DUF4342 domain-containing protein [Mucilaginibacter sp. 10I4]MEB0279471.1 DUF4342 domain-containing protein [Mucilaginibacter sp. 10B2]MEB0300032.1 DUF4342 domain-containing protein [Mucilaginibacter sp. 5C4]WPX21845.1 DUF4342 domain-containing protein [Mucilaginibacter sp. 5C4]
MVSSASNQHIKKEIFSIHGKELVNKIKELVEEGNINRITISDKHGKELMSFPLNIGLVAVVLAPVLAAVGAMAIFVGECSLIVERDVDEEEIK